MVLFINRRKDKEEGLIKYKINLINFVMIRERPNVNLKIKKNNGIYFKLKTPSEKFYVTQRDRRIE